MRRFWFTALLSLWLALPGLAWAENCTFTTSGNWTAAGTYSGTVTGTPCTLSADDNIAIGAGVTATVTTGSTVTKTTNSAVTVTGTGLVLIQSGGRLELGGGGLTATNLTLAGRFLEYDASPAFTLTEPPAEPRIGLTIPCPGWDNSASLYVEDCDENLGDPGDVAGDASEQAICWPEAQFPVASSFYDNIAAAIAVGDVIWFWDPTIDKNPPHQVNFPFEVVDVTQSAGTQHCVIVDVRQGCQQRAGYAASACPHAPSAGINSITLANREIKLATVSGDHQKGRTVVTFSTEVIGANDDLLTQYLSCPDAEGQFSNESYIIVDSTTVAGPADTVTILPGLREDLATGLRCVVGYGIETGDPVAFLRPAVINSNTEDGTDGQRGDDDITASGAFVMHGALVSHSGVVDLSTATSTTGSWSWFQDTTDNVAIRLGGMSGQVLNHWVYTGTGASTDQQHPFVGWGADMSNVTLQDWATRYHGDDSLHASEMDIFDWKIKRYICSRHSNGQGFGSGSTECIGMEGLAGTHAEPSVVATDVLAAAGVNDDISGLFLARANYNNQKIRRVVSVGNRMAMWTQDAGSRIELAGFLSLYDRQLSLGSNGSSGISTAHLQDFTIYKASMGAPINPPLSANQDFLRGLLIGVTHTQTHTGVGDASSLLAAPRQPGGHRIQDIAIIDPVTSDATDGSVVSCRFDIQPGDLSVLRRITVAWSPQSIGSNHYGALYYTDNCNFVAQFTMDGLVVAGMKGPLIAGGAALGIAPTWPATFLNGPYLENNEAIVIAGSTAPATTIYGGIQFRDPLAGDFRIPGNGHTIQKAGAPANMWAARVIGVDVCELGLTWRPECDGEDPHSHPGPSVEHIY